MGYASTAWDKEYKESLADLLEEGPAPPAALASRAPNAMSGGAAAKKPAKPAAPAKPQQAAASSSAPAASQVPGKDKTWAQLSAQERGAAHALGYNGVSWDEGAAPEKVCKAWSKLTAAVELEKSHTHSEAALSQ